MLIHCARAIVHIPPNDSLNKDQVINKYMTGIFNLTLTKPKLGFAVLPG